jgi:CheY-like chemotaxis protein
VDELIGKKILILEDDLLISMVTKRYFTRLGYLVDSETNGKSGLEYLEATEKLPDIILSDIMMPYMNGIDFLKTIRNERKYDHIPVIAITSMADELIDNKNSNFEKIIQKPFSLSDLAIDIKEVLEEKK